MTQATLSVMEVRVERPRERCLRCGCLMKRGAERCGSRRCVG